MKAVWIGPLVLSLACSSPKASDMEADADVPADTDAASEIDSFASCTGPCATTTLRAEFGSVVRNFDRAFFGLSAPDKSDSGQWEIYIETGAGADAQCPTMESPSPEYLLIAGGLAVPLAVAQASSTVSLVDFEGALLTASPVAKSTSNTVTWVAADPCIACAEGNEADRADRMVAIDFDATFEGGTVKGHSYATHCDSLDSL